LNAIFNSFTFVFLLAALYFIKQKNITLHKRFIFAAFTSTTFFLLSYVTYHYLTESTSYGGEGPLKYIYFFILITHILLAIVIVPLALITVTRGLNMQVEKHRKIARWTMPLWLYVSLTGVLVYLMIAPYYA
jgi:putative membrane protein